MSGLARKSMRDLALYERLIKYGTAEADARLRQRSRLRHGPPLRHHDARS
jgi:hypothetical protein